MLIPMFFFLAPLPLIKYDLSDILRALPLFQVRRMADLEGDLRLNQMFLTVEQGSGEYMSPAVIALRIFEAVTAVISVILIVYRIIKSYYLKKVVSSCSVSEQTEKEKQIFTGLKAESGLGRRIVLYKTDQALEPFTAGMLRPAIVIPEKYFSNEDSLKDILRHELAHIRHYDIFFIYLTLIVIAVHWYNPFCYLYYYALRNFMELYDDETVTETMNLQEKVSYCNLLLAAMEADNSENKSYLKVSFSGISKRRIKRRIDAIMNKKKTCRFLAIVFGVCILYCGAVTSFAYEDVQNIDMSQEGEEYEECGEGEWDKFVFETEAEIFLYDDRFIDEKGNVYPVEQENTYKNCKHNYESGEYQKHKKIGKGCKIDYYYAKRCTNCGNVIQKTLYSTRTWDLCPH